MFLEKNDLKLNPKQLFESPCFTILLWYYFCMLIFVDDSGDPGFRFDKGSSSIFVIALVIFNDTLEAEKTSVAIKELRRKLKVSDFYEFKFNKTNRKFRNAFF